VIVAIINSIKYINNMSNEVKKFNDFNEKVRKPRGKNKTRPLTRKQKAFADYLLNNPKASNGEAAAATYPVKNANSARVRGHSVIMNSNVQSYLSKHTNLIEDTIINTITEYQQDDRLGHRALAVNSAQWVHDKIHGKATQKIETTGVHIRMNINKDDISLVD
jgi:hypothetical protein